MNFDRLQTFAVAARELSFTRAANWLGLSQPAITQHIRELETELGVALFERRGRSVSLTLAGERLRTLAEPLLREVEQVRTALTGFQGALQGRVRIGAADSVGVFLLPYALGAFSREFPGVRASIQVADGDTLLRGLVDGTLDVAVSEAELSSSRLPGWRKLPLMEDELVLIGAANHPLAGRPITLDMLREETFIVRQSDSQTRTLIGLRLAEAGFDPAQMNVRFELGSTEGIKRAVMAELGVGFASWYAVQAEVKSGALVHLKVPAVKIVRQISLFRPPSRVMTEHVRRFCECLVQLEWMPRIMPS